MVQPWRWRPPATFILSHALGRQAQLLTRNSEQLSAAEIDSKKGDIRGGGGEDSQGDRTHPGLGGVAMEQMRDWAAALLPSGMRRKSVVVKIRCGTETSVNVESGRSSTGSNPTWRVGSEDSMLRVPRQKYDEEIMVVGVYFAGTAGRDVWLGGNTLNLFKYMDSPGNSFPEELPLYLSGDSTGGAGSGTLSFAITWIPDENAPRGKVSESPPGDMEVKLSRGKSLRTPENIVRDLSNYVDFRPMYIVGVIFFLYLFMGYGFYRGYMSAESMDDVTGVAVGKHEKLMARIQGGHGDWDPINTLVRRPAPTMDGGLVRDNLGLHRAHACPSSPRAGLYRNLIHDSGVRESAIADRDISAVRVCGRDGHSQGRALLGAAAQAHARE